MKHLLTLCQVLWIAVIISTNGYSQLWKQYSDSADILDEKNQLKEAIELYYQAKLELERDSLWTHSHARICNNIASIYTDRGEYQKAEESFLEAGQIWEKSFGKKHPYYAIMCHNLGRMFQIIGRYEQAEPYYLEAKEIRKNTLGIDHKDYIATCNNLAVLYQNSNRISEAEVLFLEVREIQANKVGRDHPDYAWYCNSLAMFYWSTGQFEKSESIFLEAKKIREKFPGKNQLDYVATCDGLANLYAVSEQYEKAESLYVESMQILEKSVGTNHPKYGSTCSHFAILYIKMGVPKKAEPLFLQSKNISGIVYGKQSDDYVRNCGNLGNYYKDMGQYDKSEKEYLEGLKIITDISGNNHPQYISFNFNLAGLYKYMNRYDEAVSIYSSIGELIKDRKGEYSKSYVEFCNNFAGLYHDLGQKEKAEKLYLQAIHLYGDTLDKKSSLFGLLCNNLANLYLDNSQFQKAMDFYLEARLTWENNPGKNHPNYAKNSNGLASLFKTIGQFREAEKLYLEAKDICEKTQTKRHPDYASCVNNLGSLYSSMAQYEKAESFYLEAKQLREQVVGKQHTNYASSCNNLAGLYMNLGQYPKAELFYLESKNIYELILGKKHPQYALGCNNLAILYDKIGQYEKAESLYLDARHILEINPGKKHPDYALNCNNLALLYMHMNKHKIAESLYVEAIQIIEQTIGKNNQDYTLYCNNLAVLYMNMSTYSKAELPLLEAKKINDTILGKLHPEYIDNCRNLGILYWNLKAIDKAQTYFAEALNNQYGLLKQIFQFTSESEKLTYLNTISRLHKYFLSFTSTSHLYKQQGFAYDFSLANRNLILTSTQQLHQAVHATSDSTLTNLYADWITLREQLAYWYPKPKTHGGEYVKSLLEKMEIVEKDLTRFSQEFRNEREDDVGSNWEKIKQNLKDNEAAIEFVDFDYFDGSRATDSTFYIALVIRKEYSEPRLVKLFEKKQLDRLLQYLNDQSTIDRINLLYSGSTSLYNLIWKPIEKYLRGISKVYFASAGDLFKISFAALPVNARQVLSDKYQLEQLNTTAAVVNNEQTYLTAEDKIQLYGGVLYDADSTALKQTAAQYSPMIVSSRPLPGELIRGDGFGFLPGSLREVLGIEKQAANALNSISLLTGMQATEESFKVLSGRNSPSVIHLATHGFFFPDPTDSTDTARKQNLDGGGKNFKHSDNPLIRAGLLFSGANHTWQGKAIDGVEDGILTAYEVSNMYLPQTKLVTLSACETALGDIVGSEGVYGLQRAFKMAGAHQLVMSLWIVGDAETSEFMQLFYQNMFNKQSIDNAFYNAQATMKNRYRTEPYKWAAWVLIK